MLYAVLDAPFLFAVQIIVYTGAVLMLFLFVLMLVGVDSADSLVETLRGQRAAAIVIAVVFAVLLIAGITQTTIGVVVGLDKANADGNVPGVAAAAVQQVRLRLRSHQRPADHRGARRDGAGAP